MSGHRTVQLLDLHEFSGNEDGTLTRNEREVPRGDVCYFAAPYDFPGYVRFWRRLVDRTKGKAASVDHLGTTMEIDCYPFGVKVYIKHERPTKRGQAGGRLVLIVEDHEGRESLATYDMTGE